MDSISIRPPIAISNKIKIDTAVFCCLAHYEAAEAMIGANSPAKAERRPGLFGIEVAETLHPFGAALRPVVDRLAVFAHAESVAAFNADVEFGGEFAFLVFEVQHRGFDGVRFVVVSDQKEHRRRIAPGC